MQRLGIIYDLHRNQELIERVRGWRTGLSRKPFGRESHPTMHFVSHGYGETAQPVFGNAKWWLAFHRSPVSEEKSAGWDTRRKSRVEAVIFQLASGRCSRIGGSRGCCWPRADRAAAKIFGGSPAGGRYCLQSRPFDDGKSHYRRRVFRQPYRQTLVWREARLFSACKRPHGRWIPLSGWPPRLPRESTGRRSGLSAEPALHQSVCLACHEHRNQARRSTHASRI